MALRWWLVAAALVAAFPEARADISVEDSLRIAGQRGQPLVLIFHATWCAPCKKLDETTLRDSNVALELAAVQVQRLDLDSAEGAAAARRFDVTSVPAIVFVDVDGSVLARHDGYVDGNTLSGSIARARRTVGSVPELVARLAQNPGDVAARLRLASRHAAIGDLDAAISEYRTVAATVGLRQSDAADATLRADELETRRVRMTSTLDAASAFVRQFPGERRTGAAIVQLAYARHVPSTELAASTTAHLQAVSRYYRRNAVHAAIAAGHVRAARPFVDRWLAAEPASRELRLLRAEVDIVDGERARGRATIAEICKPIPRELARRCYDLRAVEDRIPGAEAMRVAAARVIEALESPGKQAYESQRDALWALEESVGNAIAEALADIETRCANVARRRDYVGIELEVKPGRTIVDVRGDTPLLVACARQRLNELPGFATKHRHLHFYVAVAQAGTTTPDAPVRIGGEQFPWMLPGPARGRIGGGLAIDMVLRGGEELVTTGLALDGRFAIASLGFASLVGGVTLEASFTDDGEGVHVARGYAGLGTMLAPKLAATALAGVGASDFGPLAPNAIELPIELGLRADLAKTVRGHARLRTTFVTGDSMRQTDGVDEVAVSVGLNVHIRDRQWLLFDVAIESRAGERNAMLTFGFPLGSFF